MPESHENRIVNAEIDQIQRPRVDPCQLMDPRQESSVTVLLRRLYFRLMHRKTDVDQAGFEPASCSRRICVTPGARSAGNLWIRRPAAGLSLPVLHPA